MFSDLGHGDVEGLLLYLTELRYNPGESEWIEGDPAATERLLAVIAGHAVKHAAEDLARGGRRSQRRSRRR